MPPDDVIEEKLCARTGRRFGVTEGETSVRQKASACLGSKLPPFPSPQFCPEVREQQRLSFRNERKLYHRECSRTKNNIIALYPPDSSCPVLQQSVWWSDEYDPLAYGRDFDFARTFFEQFQELHFAVPKLAIQNAKSENCAYTNYSAENKNCYLLVGGLGSEDCYYSYRIFYSRDAVDCYDLYRCEMCYECTESTELFGCLYCANCRSSSELTLCENCIGCKNCFGCVNLRQAENMLFNESCLPEKVAEERARFLVEPELFRRRLAQLKQQNPPPLQYVWRSEDCTGSQIYNCRRCHGAKTIKNSEDCFHVNTGENNRDCADCNFFDNSELQYFCSNNEKNYGVMFCSLVWYTSNSAYLLNCFNGSNLFGCSGMKKNKYCLLNKQYSAPDYEKLLERVARHMQETGEWGRFFPFQLSPFAYNDSVAQDYYPLGKEEAIALGCRWKTARSAEMNTRAQTVPRGLFNATDTLCKTTFQCEVSGDYYRLVPQELSFYRKLKLPVPCKSPETRHRERMARVRNEDLQAPC